MRYGAPWVSGALVYGNTDLGVLANTIPLTGTSGASIFANDVTLPADANLRVRARITSWPSAGVLFVNEDGSLIFPYGATVPDGTYSAMYQFSGDGVDVGTPKTITLTVGATAITATAALPSIGLTAPTATASVSGGTVTATAALPAIGLVAPTATATVGGAPITATAALPALTLSAPTATVTLIDGTVTATASLPAISLTPPTATAHLVSPPVEILEPVTVAEACFQLRLIADVNDDVTALPEYDEVARCIVASREQCEQYTRRAFMQQTLRLTQGAGSGADLYGWGWGGKEATSAWRDIDLLRPPLISVSVVRYFDQTNALQTLDASNYYVEDGLVSVLRFVPGFSEPVTFPRRDAVQVEYVAGYPPKDVNGVLDYRANVPSSIKSAILIGVQLLFDRLTPNEREALERAKDALLSSYRVHTF